MKGVTIANYRNEEDEQGIDGVVDIETSIL